MPAYDSLTPASADARGSRAGDPWPALAGLALALIGTAVLIGWQFDIALLQPMRPGWPGIRPNTAVGFLLSGVALWQLRNQAPKGGHGGWGWHARVWPR